MTTSSELTDAKRELLARRLRGRAVPAPAGGPGWSGIPRRTAGTPAPLAPVQHNLWVADRLLSDNSVFSVHRVLRLTGPLDRTAVRHALDRLVERHEALRTTFQDTRPPAQTPQPPAPAPLRIVDLGHLPPAARRNAAVRLAEEELAQPFDLARGPVFRALLAVLDDTTHLLVLNLHHCVADEWSCGVLAREFGALYAACREGGTTELPALPVTYADYSAWQSERLSGELLDRQLAYWRTALADTPPVLELPADRVRPPVPSYRGHSARRQLPPETSSALRAYAAGHHVTLFTALLSLYGAFLHRWSGGQERFAVATPVSGRVSADTEPLIGMLANTLPIPLDHSGTPDFATLLKRANTAVLGALEHQDVTFEQLVTDSGLPRDGSRNPLAQVMFQCIEAREHVWELPGVTVERERLRGGSAKVDLTLAAVNLGETVQLDLIGESTLFEPGTVERMLDCLVEVVAQAVAAPGTPVRAVRLLTAGQERAAQDWNRTEVARPHGRTLVDLFADTVAAHPDATAVISGTTALSYRELKAAADRVAGRLRQAGARPGDLVGLHLSRGAHLLPALLGVLSAGCAYLPLPTDHPRERLTAMLHDAGAALVLTEPGHPDLASGLPTVDVRADGEPTGAGRPLGTPRPCPADLAYVLYTSGSTGRPKGVEVEHGGLLNLLLDQRDRLGAGPGDVWLGLTALSFDIAAVELYLPLITGGRLVLAPDGTGRDGAAAAGLVRAHGVTHAQATPSGWRVLLAAGAALPQLAVALTAGEPLPPALAREIRGKARRLLNGYGPTETTVFATIDELTGDDDEITIGRPLDNYTAHILDTGLRPVPVGVPGELYIGGAGVGRGYLRRPALTAERFVPDPFGPPGARLYRTGDLAARRADGRIRFLGRNDHQVKIRGHRIELGEIEARLAEHPGVAQAVVAPQETPSGTRLVGYVVGTAAEGELRRHLTAVLPAAMVPAVFVRLESMPLSANGKADRARLPAPDPGAAAPAASAPLADGAQRALAAVWTELLGVPVTGPQDNFFVLGGDSVSAVFLASKAREAGYALTTRQVFDHQTLAELAAVAEPLEPAPGAVRPTPRDFPLAGLDQEALDRILADAPPGGIQDIYPLTPLQAGMLFQSVHDPDGSAYFNQYRVDIDGDLDPDVLRSAWQHVVDRHDALRCSFRWEGVPRPLQVVHRTAPVDFQVLDWTGTPASELPGRLDALLAAERRRGFDLFRTPPHRFQLIRTGPAAHHLVWHSHHILADGWSVGPLLNEVFATATALRRDGRPPRDLPEPVPHRTYVEWLERQDPGAAERYWRDQLAGVSEPTPVPVVRRPAEGTAGGEARSVELTLDSAVVERLNRLARERRCTLGTLVQGAWALLLGRWSRRDDVVFGLTVSGRSADLPGIERTVGLLINTLPVRVRWDEDETLGDWLGRLAGQLAALRDVEHCALSDIHSWSHVPRDQRLFDSVLVFQNLALADRADLGGLAVRMGPVRQSSGLPLMLSARFAASGAVLELVHEDDHVDTADAERLLASLGHLLTTFADRPAARLRELAALPEDAHDLIVRRWNATEREFPHATTVPAMITAQAARTPDAVAVVSRGQRLSYAELDAHARALAHRLRQEGVRPGDRVALRADRSADLLVAVLAVWRAGAAYVPLDPEYPDERAAYVLSDSGATVLLASPAPPTALAAACRTVLRIEESAGEAPDGDPVTPLPADLAYVLYTSGSTGRPKGVEVAHGSLARLVAAMADVLRAAPDDVWLGLTALSFDISTVELFVPLTTGGRVVVVPEEDRWDGGAQRALIRAHGVSHVQATPSGWRLLLAAGFGEDDGVRCALTGGEALPEPLAAELTAPLPRLVNVYGPTEATVWATFDELTGHDGEITIGRPLPNYTAHVLDDGMRPLPIGAPGELYLGGAGVARGYHDRPGLTAERFVPDPFGPPGARLYRTGDLAARRADGRIRFLGRNDHQVKIRGHRIELGEIEEALTRHPHVAMAAVAVHRDGSGEPFLTGYVCGAGPDPADLRDFLRGELPRAMVPARFVVLERMPLSPAGKIDRGALPDPGAAAPETDRHIAPRTPAERALAEIWQEVLGVAEVGVSDDFFALGGNSVKAVLITARARERGLALTTRRLFAHPTVEALAATPTEVTAPESGTEPFALAGLTPAELDVLLGTVGRADTEDVLPLSPLQTGLLLHTLAETADYVRTFAVDLDGAFDQDAFEEAWRYLVDRYAILRSTFRWADVPHPVQVVRRRAAPEFTRVDLTGLPGEERAARLAELTEDERRTVFDLAEAPPARFLLVRLAEDRHRFVWTTHHIVFDGWSLHALFAEAFTAYRHRADIGRLPDAPPPPPYRDYLRWLQRQGADGGTARALERWRTELAGFTRPTPLPGSRPTGRPAAVHTERQALPAGLLTALDRTARRHRVTVGTLVHTAWALLLASTSGERDVLFGTTLSGRFGDVPGIESMVGLLMNTLPLRLDVDPDTPPAALLRSVHQRLAGLAGREHVSLGEVQRAAEVPGGKRLFDSLVVFTDVGTGSLPKGVRPVPESEVRDTGYPLVLEAVRTDRLVLELGCDRSRYDEPTARRLLAQTVRLLTALTEDHDRAAGLPMLSEEEYGLVVRDWNATGAGFPAERTLHSLIEEQAARTPDALAVRCGAEGLTYAELNSRANRVAHRLRRMGVGAGSLVALCTERSLEHVIGVVAILKASAAFVPVDPEHPARRQAYILADARAQAVLTQRRLVESLPDGAETAVPVLALDDPAVWQDEPDHDPAPVALPADLCSLYYTSGSTGRPKGVASTHEGWVNRMWWMQRRHGLQPGDAVLHKTTLTFDDAAVEILWPLITGGQVVLLAPGAHRDAHEIADAVIRHGVVHVQFVPSVLEVFLDVLTPERAAAMTRLRSVLTSGEALRPVLVRRFRELFGDRVSLDNTWGATEVSIDSTFHVCTQADVAAEDGAVSLGRPFDNNTVYVLDADMSPVPVGISGELFIGGLGLARGYHGRPGLTAERFVPDPFGPPGARLYRTGDLGRWRADGTLEFGGRTDHQVKIGGVRVELGEIEDALRRAPGVKDAVVDVRALDGVKILVGYTTGGTAPEQLRAALRAELPDAMVPNAFVALDAVPLNANGKVDRAALPDPEPDAGAAAQSYVAPRTATEETLAGIWARVLRVRRVGVHDDFRVMGGDSILLIHTVARAREAGLPVTPRMVFEHPTIAGLAAAIDAAAARGRAVVVHAEQGRVTGEVPLGPIQAQYAELGPRDRFNQSLLLAVDATVAAGPLRAALSALAGHHDALRLRWTREADGWRQYLAEAEDADLLTVVDAAEEAAAVEAAHAGLDLAHGPLLRAVLLRPARRLLLVVHHVAVDTVSWNILVEDLNTLVAGGALPAKTTSVQYWARRLAEHAASTEFRPEAEYWALPRPAAAPLPLDRADGENTEGRSRTVRVVLPAAVTEALLRRAPAAHGAEPDHLMLAALARTLTEWTGGDTAAFDVERHGREALFDEVDLSRTVGWFTGVRPVVVTLPDPDDTAACVAAVREHLRAAPAGSVGDGLARHLRPGTRDTLAGRPRPQVCFNYHGRRDGTGTVAGAFRPLPQALGEPVDPEQRRSHLVEIDSAVLEGQLHLVWRYAADHFDAATVEDLAERYLRRLTALVEHSATPGAVRRPAEPFVERLFAGTPAPLLPMLRHRVPGVGIAVIADGELRGAWGFGTLGTENPTPVDARTLFQVGSISKHVTALAVLRLVQEGRLDLDTDVNRLLTTWRLPGEGGVTLRHLLSHTSGLGEQAYHGYRGDERMPALREVLDGRPPAVTPAVRPERPPGSGYQYSSSNYAVVQQVLEDVTGQPFGPLLRSLVLEPLGMSDSDFAPDAPYRYDGPVAVNHRLDGTAYPEGWHLYPESAAGGLWSTPADVARVAIEIQRAVAGGPAAFLTAESAAEMLRPVPGTPGGLGTIGKPYGERRWFGHTGGVPGFRSLTWADPDRGLGLVVTSNSDAGEDFLRELLHELGVGLEDARW
ncbi:non-ribosomal peptide synthetase [Streptomyces sp. CoH27]|uniref:non-ribosomal peptide synthetase n=1 Tax=Streptomyces sp. CoH27 TaxID=2875763 RepID=UPI001CD6EC98|nr:non-ribosomal peptide synthetase [Streptomyces sp. CoH27]